MLDTIFSGLMPAVDFSFVPTQGDISVDSLSKIFGTVGNILNGRPGIVGHLFYTFNFIALAVSIIIFIYHIIFGTMHTASDGEVMGKQEHGARRLIQSTAAVGFLTPTASGYCLAQVLVMQLVVWGIGAADSLWNSALDYFIAGGSVYDSFLTAPTNNPQPTDEDRIVDRNNKLMDYRRLMGDMLTLKTCQLTRNYQLATGDYNIVYSSSGNSDRTTPTINVGTKGGDAIECGYLDASKVTSGQANAVINIMNGPNILTETAEYVAKQHASITVGSPPFTSSKASNGNCGYTGSSGPTDTSSSQCKFDQLVLRLADNVPPGALDLGVKLPEREFLNDLKAPGWLLAGNYYRVLLRLESGNGSFASIPAALQAKSKEVDVYSRESPSFKEKQFPKTRDVVRSYWLDYGSASNKDMIVGTMQDSYASMEATADSIPKEFEQYQMLDMASSALLSFLQHLRVSAGGGDPLQQLTSYGYDKMNTAVAGFILTMSASLISGIASITVLGNGVAGMASAIIGAILPSLYAINGFNYTQGAILSVYLPLIPVVIFLTSGLGWMIAVIESMVAAPLVALGLILPDGQQHVLGRAEPAVMMILNLFLRPSLLILGFIISLILVFIGLFLLNTSFTTMIEFAGFQVDGMFGPLVMETAYFALAVVIVKKCFDLIHQVPDKVLLWIGDRSQHVGGADEALGAAKSGTDTGAGHAAKTGEASASGAQSERQTATQAHKGARESGTWTGKGPVKGDGVG